MRRRGLSIFVFLLALATAATARPAQARTSVSISFFHSELSPYGEWVSLAGYGPCWRPLDVAYDWQPYLDGEWVWTDEGWTWVSYDPWGADPYHYGTWVDDVEFGWCWVPGTIWAPAWVTWYVSDEYCGWAPVPPTLALDPRGYTGPAVRLSPASYVFVPTSRLAGVDVRRVRVPRTRNALLVRGSEPVTRFPVSGGVVTTVGPSPQRVARIAGRPVKRVSISTARTTPVPIAAAVRSGKARVVAPLPERQRVIRTAPATATRRAARPAARTSRAAPPPARVTRPAPPPAKMAHAAPAPRTAAPARLPAAGRTGPPPVRAAPPPQRVAPPPRPAHPPQPAPPGREKRHEG